MKQILFRVTDEQHAELTEMAASEGVSVQKYIQSRLGAEVQWNENVR
ncbi:toxin-antitoxin system HicB family antitoxin [Salmonella enterica]|nr:toxin-antitoxin system HicB family antitoxin [Salmonella enterica]